MIKDDTSMAGPPPVAGVGPLVAGTMPPPPAPRPHSGSAGGEVVELVTESGSRLVHYPNPQKTPRPPAPRGKKCRRICYTLVFLILGAAAYLGYAYVENKWPLEDGFCLRKNCGQGVGRDGQGSSVGTNAKPLDSGEGEPDAGTGGNGSLRAGTGGAPTDGSEAGGEAGTEAPLVEPGTVFEFGVDLTDDSETDGTETTPTSTLAPAPAPALATASAGSATTLNLLDRRLNVAAPGYEPAGALNAMNANNVLGAVNPALVGGSVMYNPKPLPPPRFAHLDFSVTALEVGSDRALMMLSLSEKNDANVLRMGGLLGAKLFYEETKDFGIGEAWGPEGQLDDATEALRALLQFTSGNQDFATELEDGEDAARAADEAESVADKAGAKLRLRSVRTVKSGAHAGLKVTAVREKLSALGGLVNTRVTVASGDGRRSRTVDAKVVRKLKLKANVLKATVSAAFKQRDLFRARQAAKLKAEGLANAFDRDVVAPASSHAALLNGGRGRMLFPGGHCGACKKTCRRKWYCLWLCKVCTKRKSCTRQFAAMKSTCYFIYEKLKGMDCANWTQSGPSPCPGTSTVSWGSWFTCFFVGVEMDSGGNVNPGGSLEMFKHASGWVGNPPRLHEYRGC